MWKKPYSQFCCVLKKSFDGVGSKLMSKIMFSKNYAFSGQVLFLVIAGAGLMSANAAEARHRHHHHHRGPVPVVQPGQKDRFAWRLNKAAVNIHTMTAYSGQACDTLAESQYQAQLLSHQQLVVKEYSNDLFALTHYPLAKHVKRLTRARARAYQHELDSLNQDIAASTARLGQCTPQPTTAVTATATTASTTSTATNTIMANSQARSDRASIVTTADTDKAANARTSVSSAGPLYVLESHVTALQPNSGSNGNEFGLTGSAAFPLTENGVAVVDAAYNSVKALAGGTANHSQLAVSSLWGITDGLKLGGSLGYQSKTLTKASVSAANYGLIVTGAPTNGFTLGARAGGLHVTTSGGKAFNGYYLGLGTTLYPTDTLSIGLQAERSQYDAAVKWSETDLALSAAMALPAPSADGAAPQLHFDVISSSFSPTGHGVTTYMIGIKLPFGPGAASSTMYDRDVREGASHSLRVLSPIGLRF